MKHRSTSDNVAGSRLMAAFGREADAQITPESTARMAENGRGCVKRAILIRRSAFDQKIDLVFG